LVLVSTKFFQVSVSILTVNIEQLSEKSARSDLSEVICCFPLMVVGLVKRLNSFSLLDGSHR
jgi:hypothetical protein